MAKILKTVCALAFVLLVVASCEAASTGSRKMQGGPSPTYACFKPNYSVYNRLDCSFGTDKGLCLKGDPTFDDYRICCQASFSTQPDEYWGCPFPKGTIPESCYYIEWNNTPPSCEPTTDSAKCGALFSYSSLGFCKDVLVTKGINSP